jgi:hypothetical protein
MGAELMGVDWPQPVITVFEACRRLRLKPNQVRRLCLVGKLLHWRCGHTLAIAASSITRLLEQGGAESTLRTREFQLDLGLTFPEEPRTPEE